MTRSDLEKDEALVLRSLRHGDTSRIVTLFTRKHGRLAVIAKGARRSKTGGSGGALETPSLIEAMIYIKSSRSVQLLGQISTLNTYPVIKQDLILNGYASALLEIINLSFTDNEPNHEAFDIAVRTLDKLNKKIGDPRVNLWLFQIKILSLSGFAINPFFCPLCNRESGRLAAKNLFWIQAGAVCCSECRPQTGESIPLSGESVSLLRKLVDDPNPINLRLKPSPSARREISGLLIKFLKFHIPNIGKMPAMMMLDRFENLQPAAQKKT